jgi:photosystem II stability/assembly factor-like uncharacterized protein
MELMNGGYAMQVAALRVVVRRLGLGVVAALMAVGGGRPAGAGINVWTPLGPNGGPINALAASPAQAGLLWAGSDGAGVYRSQDGGASWVRTSRGLPYAAVTSIVADPQDAATVYVVGEAQAAVSSNSGASWQSLASPSQFAIFYALAVDPSDPATLYAGSQPGIYKSGDRGATWTELPAAAHGRVTALAIDPGAAATVYGYDQLNKQLLRTADGGASWSVADQGLPLGSADASTPLLIAVDPRTKPGIVYVAYTSNSQPQTYRSADAGATWQAVEPGGYPLAVGLGVVYAGATRSTDGGNTWTATNVAPGQPLALAAAPGSATAVYAGTTLRGVWSSQDAAATWQQASSGINATNTLALVIDPVHPRNLYAVVGDAAAGPGLLKSGSSGQQWHLVGPAFVADYLGTLAIDPVTPTTLYAGSPQGLIKTTDGGNTWSVLAGSGHGACIGVSQLGIDPSHTDDIYVVASAGFLSGCFGGCPAFKSADGGNTWSCLKLGTTSIEALFVGPGVLYAFATFSSPHGRQLGDLFRSTDGGASWQQIDAGLHTTGGRSMGFVTLAIDPADGNRVLLSEQQGVFLTTNGGATWAEADGKLPIKGTIVQSSPTLLAIDPQAPATMYAGGGFGVYRTTNGGKSWYPIVGGLPQFALSSFGNLTGTLTLSPRQPATLYAGTIENGIYTYTVQ